MRLSLDQTIMPNYDLDAINKIEIKLQVIDLKEPIRKIYNRVKQPVEIKNIELGEPSKISINPSVFKFNTESPTYFAELEKNDLYQFYPFEEPPELIGGFESLKRKIYYPEMARRLGIEDNLKIYFLVDVDGRVKDFKLAKRPKHENMGFTAAAIQAIIYSRWRPAKQRGKPVKVGIVIPFVFKLEYQ